MTEQYGASQSRYQFGELISRGSIADVYRGYDLIQNQNVAIKMIRQDFWGMSLIQQLSPRFAYDAQALARLKHPHIIRLIDYSNLKGVPFWVMELLNGGSIRQYMGKPILWRQACGMIAPVAQALAFAHQQGILHLDLKPENILLNENGAPILTNFGTAAIIRLTAYGSTPNVYNVGAGNPEYMAPEQIAGARADQRTDIYSLGIILYELLTGYNPFRGQNIDQTMFNQLNSPLPSPSSMGIITPPQIEQAVMIATAKTPESRYENMAIFSDLLNNMAMGNIPYSQQFQNPNTQYRQYQPQALADQFFANNPYATTSVEEDNDRHFAEKRKKILIGSIILGVLAVILTVILIISGNNRKESMNATSTAEMINQTITAIQVQLNQQQTVTQIANEMLSKLSMDATQTAMAMPPPPPAEAVAPPSVPEAPVVVPTINAVNPNVAKYQGQTVADGAKVAPGQAFTIAWTMENTGSSKWGRDYKLKFITGTNYSTGPVTEVFFPEEVWPGGASSLAINCVAPGAPGTYTMEWALTDAEGNNFYNGLTQQIIVEGAALTPTPLFSPMPTNTTIPTPTVFTNIFN